MQEKEVRTPMPPDRLFRAEESLFSLATVVRQKIGSTYPEQELPPFHRVHGGANHRRKREKPRNTVVFVIAPMNTPSAIATNMEDFR